MAHTANSDVLVSIAIPCYEMHGRGAEFLDYGLGRVAEQTHPRIEVVVSDHSRDDAVELVCKHWEDSLPIEYVRNAEKRGSSSANLNVAIGRAHGDLIKILCQDDYLFDATAIERIVDAFRETDYWLVSSYLHTRDRETLFRRQDPRMTADIAGNNTIGTHSCLTIRNVAEPELFAEDLIWLMDCEYYRRLYARFGAPRVLHDVTMVQMLWEGQVTHTAAAAHDLREREEAEIRKRYPEPLTGLPPSGKPPVRARRLALRLKRMLRR
jgi:glycosyltransferase involved in cell wall biosynthesis